MTGRVEISHDRHRNVAFAADWLVNQMDASVGTFRLALSGGNTPRELYQLLAQAPRRDQIPWRRLELYFGDERFVPPTDRASNFRMVYETLLEHVPITPEQVHPIPTDGTVEDAAARYEALLKRVYGADQFVPERPLFDVVLLGVGADGHTASLFPGSRAVDEMEHWVSTVPGGQDEHSPARITLTYPAIESSRAVAFLVAGEDKQKAVMDALAGNRALPAARVRSHGEVVWFIDRAAAGPLRRP